MRLKISKVTSDWNFFSASPLENYEDQGPELCDSGAFSLPGCDRSSSISSKNSCELMAFNPLKEQLEICINPNNYIHQSISKIVSGLEDCEVKPDIWRPSKNGFLSETYVWKFLGCTKQDGQGMKYFVPDFKNQKFYCF